MYVLLSVIFAVTYVYLFTKYDTLRNKNKTTRNETTLTMFSIIIKFNLNIYIYVYTYAQNNRYSLF